MPSIDENIINALRGHIPDELLEKRMEDARDVLMETQRAQCGNHGDDCLQDDCPKCDPDYNVRGE